MGTQHVRIEQVGPSTSRATIRSHSAVVDRPLEKGGTDKGPLGGEYFLTGLGGCFTSHLLAAIRTREAPVSNVAVELTGTLEGSPERFTTIGIRVSAACDDGELLRKLVTIADRSCQVMNTLRDAVRIAIEVRETAPVVGVSRPS
jgi:putative redox protein